MSFWDVSAPTWLQGIGTIGAFTTGGIILLRELRRDRGRRLVDDQKQASAVSAWVVRSEHGAANTLTSQLHLSNTSEAPVYDMILRYEAGGGPNIEEHVGVLPPGQANRSLPGPLEEGWVKSANGWLRSKPISDMSVADPSREAWPCQISLRFRDAAGVYWTRAADGSLSRL